MVGVNVWPDSKGHRSCMLCFGSGACSPWTGKTVPIIANDSLEDGQLAYWYQNKSSYNGVGITATPPQLASATLALVQALFKGEGVKVSDVVLNTPLVTDANVADWYTSSMTTSSTGNASGPSSLNVLPTSELDELLSNPSS